MEIPTQVSTFMLVTKTSEINADSNHREGSKDL
jgi:hypothetical protein